jgi:hypothetical protein
MRAFILLALLALPLAGCDKPGEQACQQAIDNINKIYGSPQTTDTRPWVAKCRAHSTKQAVQCMIDAKTKEDVEVCEAAKK